VVQETALEMIHTIREAFNELLADNDWMDDETRAVAKQKADAMNERIGYPELLTDEEELIKEYVMVRRHSSTPSGKMIQRFAGAVSPFGWYVDLNVMWKWS
jgi:predicted metalloendopeptidase